MSGREVQGVAGCSPGQRGPTRPTLGRFALASLRDCPTDGVEQRMFVDGLPQVAGGPGVFDTLAAPGTTGMPIPSAANCS